MNATLLYLMGLNFSNNKWAKRYLKGRIRDGGCAVLRIKSELVCEDINIGGLTSKYEILSKVNETMLHPT